MTTLWLQETINVRSSLHVTPQPGPRCDLDKARGLLLFDLNAAVKTVITAVDF